MNLAGELMRLLSFRAGMTGGTSPGWAEVDGSVGFDMTAPREDDSGKDF